VPLGSDVELMPSALIVTVMVKLGRVEDLPFAPVTITFTGTLTLADEALGITRDRAELAVADRPDAAAESG
jgi:hypothetical protein